VTHRLGFRRLSPARCGSGVDVGDVLGVSVGDEVVDGVHESKGSPKAWSTASIASPSDAEWQPERPGRRWSSGAVADVDLLRG
jgi:hypothetical protein